VSIISKSLPSTLPALPVAYSRHCSLFKNGGFALCPDSLSFGKIDISDSVPSSAVCKTLPARCVRVLNCSSRACIFSLENSRNFSWALDVARLPLAIRSGLMIGLSVESFFNPLSDLKLGSDLKSESGLKRGSAFGFWSDMDFLVRLFSRITWEKAPSMVMEATKAL